MSELDRGYADRVRRDYQEFKKDPNLMHNRDLHKRIKEVWRQVSPQFYRRLREAKLLEQAAFVEQERMWREQDRLLQAGLPWPDAREQSERRLYEPDVLEPTEGDLARERQLNPEVPPNPRRRNP